MKRQVRRPTVEGGLQTAPQAGLKTRLYVPLALAAVATLVLSAQETLRLPNNGQAVLYENARLIPGDGQAAVVRAALLVRDGRISRVGRAGEVGLPQGAARVDLAGKTLIPTFINVHTHTGFQRGGTYTRENYSREVILDD